MLNLLASLDDNILLFFQEAVRNPVLTPVFKIITTLGNGGAVWIGLTILMLILPRTRKIGFMTTLSLIGTLLVNNVFLKNVVNRTRPYEVIEGLTYLVRAPIDSSFPSGHSACSFAVACVMYRRLPKRYGVPALILAVLIAVSRLYVGVHYPSDVLFGTISGIVISYGAEALAKWIMEQRRIHSGSSEGEELRERE